MGLEDLMRAASAAGFAMATVDDDLAETPSRDQPVTPRSAEDLARGGQRSLPAYTLPAVIARSAPPVPAAKSLIPSASSVRETVYSYLGRGLPA